MTDKKLIGNRGEDAVIACMASEGYRFLARNFSVHNIGEIDVVMTKGGDLYIVEVKSRLSGTMIADPASSITFSKRMKLKRTAEIFISRYNLYHMNVHFLAGCVTHDRDGLIQNVEIIPF